MFELEFPRKYSKNNCVQEVVGVKNIRKNFTKVVGKNILELDWEKWYDMRLVLLNERASRVYIVLKLDLNSSKFVQTRLKIKRVLSMYIQNWLEHFLCFEFYLISNTFTLLNFDKLKISSFENSKLAHLWAQDHLVWKLKTNLFKISKSTWS